MAGFDQELRTAYKTGKITLGTKTSIKNLKMGKTKLVIISRNTDPNVKEDVQYYASMSKTLVYKYDGTSHELGMLLGKPFPIQVLAVLDAGDSHIMEIVE